MKSTNANSPSPTHAASMVEPSMHFQSNVDPGPPISDFSPNAALAILSNFLYVRIAEENEENSNADEPNAGHADPHDGTSIKCRKEGLSLAD